MPMTVTVSLKTPGSVDGCIWCKVHALLLQAVKGAGRCGEAGAWQDTLTGGHEGGHCGEIRRSGLLEHASGSCGFLHAGGHDHPARQHFPAFAPLCNAASVRVFLGILNTLARPDCLGWQSETLHPFCYLCCARPVHKYRCFPFRVMAKMFRPWPLGRRKSTHQAWLCLTCNPSGLGCSIYICEAMARQLIPPIIPSYNI